MKTHQQLAEGSSPPIFLIPHSSPFHACDRTSTRQYIRHQFDACKKYHVPLLFMTLIVCDIGIKKMKEQKYQIE